MYNFLRPIFRMIPTQILCTLNAPTPCAQINLLRSSKRSRYTLCSHNENYNTYYILQRDDSKNSMFYRVELARHMLWPESVTSRRSIKVKSLGNILF